MLPLIGLTCYRKPQPTGPWLLVNEAYTRAVSRAGGVPVLVPLGLNAAEMDTIVQRVDGILFTGGGDVLPERYGSQPHPMVDDVDTDRDRVEIELYQRTIQARKPFLGVCRGLQVINIAQGGTLYEDIHDQHESAMRHSYYPDLPYDLLAHSVHIEPDSRLAAITGQDEAQVNSLHHQGIRRLGASLRATAFSPDGLVEAIELEGYPFGLAVQWHPEWLPDLPPMQAIFRHFIQAAVSTRVTQV